MNDITKLFFIINCYSMGGGAESLLTTIMNALYDTGRYHIGVMEIIHAEIKKEPIREGIKIFPYYTRADAVDRNERMYYVYHEWDYVISEYIPDDYDVYISFNYLKPTFLLPSNKKSISWIHSDVYDLINKYPNQMKDLSEERELQRKAFGNVNRIVAISDITEQSINEIFPEYKDKTVLLTNGVDVDVVRKKATESTDIILEGYPVVFIGRFEQRKNPIRAVEIFCDFVKHQKDANLYFLGYGPMEEELRDCIKEKGLSEHAFILGYFDNPFPIIRQARLTLMTSYSEGFPMALLESVALGVPFVSTIVGGSRILSADKCVGDVFDNNDEAVSEMLRFAKTNSDIIQRACKNTIKEYDLPLYINRIERLIDEVMLEPEK